MKNYFLTVAVNGTVVHTQGIETFNEAMKLYCLAVQDVCTRHAGHVKLDEITPNGLLGIIKADFRVAMVTSNGEISW